MFNTFLGVALIVIAISLYINWDEIMTGNK